MTTPEETKILLEEIRDRQVEMRTDIRELREQVTENAVATREFEKQSTEKWAALSVMHHRLAGKVEQCEQRIVVLEGAAENTGRHNIESIQRRYAEMKEAKKEMADWVKWGLGGLAAVVWAILVTAFQRLYSGGK